MKIYDRKMTKIDKIQKYLLCICGQSQKKNPSSFPSCSASITYSTKTYFKVIKNGHSKMLLLKLKVSCLQL